MERQSTESDYDFEDVSKCYYCNEPNCNNCKILKKYAMQEKKNQHRRKKMRTNEGYFEY